MTVKSKKSKQIEDEDEKDLIAFFTFNLFKNKPKQDDYQEESTKLNKDDRYTTS